MSLLDEVYKAVILEHGRRPRNKGRLDPSDGEARGYNPLCGDDTSVFVRLDADGRVGEIAFEGKGCAISQSSASLMTEAAAGKSPEEIAALAERFYALVKSRPDVEPADEDEALGELLALAGVRKLPMRVKCATLAWHALENALRRAGESRADSTTDAAEPRDDTP